MVAGLTESASLGTVTPPRVTRSRGASTCPADESGKSSTTPATVNTHFADLKAGHSPPLERFVSSLPATFGTVRIARGILATETSGTSVNRV